MCKTIFPGGITQCFWRRMTQTTRTAVTTVTKTCACRLLKYGSLQFGKYCPSAIFHSLSCKSVHDNILHTNSLYIYFTVWTHARYRFNSITRSNLLVKSSRFEYSLQENQIFIYGLVFPKALQDYQILRRPLLQNQQGIFVKIKGDWVMRWIFFWEAFVMKVGGPINDILFYSILFYSILFYSILFYSILFYSILFYYITFYSVLFYSILFYSILF